MQWRSNTLRRISEENAMAQEPMILATRSGADPSRRRAAGLLREPVGGLSLIAPSLRRAPCPLACTPCIANCAQPSLRAENPLRQIAGLLAASERMTVSAMRKSIGNMGSRDSAHGNRLREVARLLNRPRIGRFSKKAVV